MAPGAGADNNADMHKLFFGLSITALLIAATDINAPLGSPAALEAGFLLIGAALAAVVGLVTWLRGTRKCPACAERVPRHADRCRHCGAELPQK